MSFSRFSHRIAAPVVLAAYLLAATASGLWHHHGDACCAYLACPGETCDRHESLRADEHCHHHHRSAGTKARGTNHFASERTHDRSSGPATPANERRGNHAPLRHADCAACQFLGQLSVATPVVSMRPVASAAPFESDESPRRMAAIVADAHLARGPPPGSERAAA